LLTDVAESKITYIKCDVTSPSSIAAAAGEVRALLGEPSILVNNAGVGRPHSIVDTSTEWATKIFQINIISHFWLTREFLPDMIKKNKGHVVGLASMASFVAPPGIVDYASTKAAVMAFHEGKYPPTLSPAEHAHSRRSRTGLGQEIKHVYKSPGVLNTVVHPSWVRTALTHGYEEHLEKTQGGLMKPEHVGRKIADQIFSCSGGQLVIPRRLSVAAGLRGHANWVHQAILDFSVGGAAADFPAPEK
jgi:short-subunit dehydrogenase